MAKCLYSDVAHKEIIGVFLQQMSLGEDNWNGEPRCEKQRLEEPPGSGDPLHLIFEEYADDQVTHSYAFSG